MQPNNVCPAKVLASIVFKLQSRNNNFETQQTPVTLKIEAKSEQIKGLVYAYRESQQQISTGNIA